MTTNNQLQASLLQVDAPATTTSAKQCSQKTRKPESQKAGKPENQPPFEPLQLKYRPQLLSELVGQKPIATMLTNALELDRIAPGYAFVGGSGTGKTTTARILAMSLNCQEYDEPTAEPCGVCASCTAIERGIHLDYIEIDAASNNGVDQVRALIENAHFHPSMGRYKVIVLDEAHMLSSSAQNALLKTLEEPPRNVVFVLATTDPQKLLPTILGRCQVLPFRTLGNKALAGHLQWVAEQEGIELDDAAAVQLAKATQGQVRNALQLLGTAALTPPITAEAISQLVGDIPPATLWSLMVAIASNKGIEAMQQVSTLLEEGKLPKNIVASLASAFRDVLLLHAAPDAEASDFAQVQASVLPFNNLSKLQSKWSVGQLNLVLERLRETDRQLYNVTNPQTWLEVCVMNLTPRHLALLEQEGGR